MKSLATNDSHIRSLIGNPLYRIWTSGKIEKLVRGDKWQTVSQHIDNGGYLKITYESKKLSVHRIVFQKFVGELKPNLVVNHKDGIKTNNAWANLELVSQSQNNLHRYRSLGHKAIKGNKTIDFRIAEAMRFLNKKHGISGNELAKAFNMSKSWVSQVLSNKIWTSI